MAPRKIIHLFIGFVQFDGIDPKVREYLYDDRLMKITG